MIAGKIRFINSDRGFLFVRPDDSSADCFCHFTVLQREGIQPTGLQVGDAVEFERGPSLRSHKDQVIAIRLR
jgi:CspA family cold shock protein